MNPAAVRSAGRGGLLRMAVLGVVAALTLGLGVSPAAAADSAPAERPPTSTVRSLPAHLVPGGPFGLNAKYGHDVRLYYWGAEGPLYVESGEVSLDVFCTGWGWFHTQWMSAGPWWPWVDCGSFIPATQFRFLER